MSLWLLGSGCQALLGIEDVQIRDDDSGVPDGPVAGNPDAAGNAPDAAGNTPDAAGDASVPDAGPPPDVLVDRELVVRHFINEATSGQNVSELIDSADTPVNMPIIYYTNLSYVEVGGHRGLRWIAIESDGYPSVLIDGTKIKTRLQGAQTATIEVVADVEAASNSDSRLTHIGKDLERGRFSLTCGSTGRLILRWNNDDNIGEWQISLPTSGRVVFHAVVDTTQADANARVKLYADGQELSRIGGTPPPQNATLDLGTGRYYVIGNREAYNRSIKGNIYYAAMYAAALNSAEVAVNAAKLSADDDAP